MHETVVAKSVLETVLLEAQKINAKPLSAKISCGQLNPIQDEVLNFAFELAAKDTVAEGMNLNVIHIPLKAKCNGCENEFKFDIYSPDCPICRNADIQIGDHQMLFCARTVEPKAKGDYSDRQNSD